MAKGQNLLKRREKERRYKKLFLIATEGQCTEKEYFSECLAWSESKLVRVAVLTSKGETSPKQVLKRLKDELKAEKLIVGDEAWVVVDRDNWDEASLNTLFSWERVTPKPHYIKGVAVSNPCFEFWLLLHFEDGKNITQTNLRRRLEKYLPGYDKHLDRATFTRDKIDSAIRRADTKRLEAHTWPQSTGTQVHLLVKRIIAVSDDSSA